MGPTVASRSSRSRRTEWGRRGPRRDIQVKRLAGAGAALLCVLVVLLAPLMGSELVDQHALFIRAPALRATIETAIVLCALSAAWLFSLDFQYTRHLDRLVLLVGLLCVAGVELGSGVLPATLGFDSGKLSAVAACVGGVFTAATFALAGRVKRDEQLRPGRRLVAPVIGCAILALGLAELGALLLQGSFANAGPIARQASAAAPRPPVGVGLSLSAAALLIVAVVGFARKTQIGDRRVSPLLTMGFAVLAAAELQYVVTPRLSEYWVGSRGGLRLVGYALILASALRQEAASRREVVHIAALHERQQIARDLHDGLAQDLAFIAAHGERIASQVGDDYPLAVAARRALATSRGAIIDLSASGEPTARAAMWSIADELGGRFGMRIALEVEDLELSPETRENVVRIAREAIVNAAHGKARHVVVSLSRHDYHFTMRVRDDGCGIGSADHESRSGFGLRSMRERAAKLDGSLVARQTADGGTELEVVFR
jgi:signal transduction histidine kinase